MKALLTVLTLTLWVALAGCADDSGSSPRPTEAEKMTVAGVLKGLSLDETKLDYIDEPPGKLRALECEATFRDTKVKVRVRIHVVYTHDLFSVEQKWNPKAVRAATVHKVTITPLDAEK
jgi:hypothetical protein